MLQESILPRIRARSESRPEGREKFGEEMCQAGNSPPDTFLLILPEPGSSASLLDVQFFIYFGGSLLTVFPDQQNQQDQPGEDQPARSDDSPG